MTVAGRVDKIKLRRTPRRIAITWIAWVHEFGPAQVPSPLPDLLREMECDLFVAGFDRPLPSRHSRKNAKGESVRVQAARFHCFFLIDLYAQVFLLFADAMTASLRRIVSVLLY